MTRALELPDSLHATCTAENRLVIDRADNEVFVGLNRDESERLALYWLHPVPDRQNRQDKYALEERHRRVCEWWQRALQVAGDEISAGMTAEAAFEAGRAASRRAKSDLDAHLEDFDFMIASVPRGLRLAAIYGWLSAFDDEADRIGAASRN